MIRLFVGLGNPGTEYDDTRHNAGFWYIDQLARRLDVRLSMDRAYHGFMARANTPQGPVWLLQPQTYMNLSGKSVAALARFFKIAPNEILVAHDELDMLPGQVKLKQGGGHAGHNGLRDTHAQLGSPDYWRLRLGIGHPGVKAEVAAYVLRKPPSSERELIEQCIDKALQATDALLAGDMAKATTTIHAGAQRPKPPKLPRPAETQAAPTTEVAGKSSTPKEG
ncbi:MAG: aminoacyl-tRNA hydrolase [Aquabacterium sp.]|jgi:peptidyl-tRNA hydrolase, PTH1 family|uniref:aminoacyl-tRNA hydrolase n=1 Tax=Aquabacterium sp. TaxID=1872578 RepID=UPI003BB01B59